VPTKPVEFHDEAGAEYDAAFDWYLERSPDAALEFDSEVAGALNEIASAPHRWAAGPSSTRRYLLRRFPYILIYRERASGDIQVVAVAHTSRKPGYWKKRL
jgi:plasmid stabilization system protein ParE